MANPKNDLFTDYIVGTQRFIEELQSSRGCNHLVNFVLFGAILGAWH